MRLRACLILALSLIAVPALAQQQQPIDTDDNSLAGSQVATLNLNLSYLWNGSIWVRMIGDATNGLKVNCTTGCQGSVTDADDATVAAGQTGLALNISQTNVFDGTNWKRFTIGTAGSASAQVVTVQGIASMTALTMAGAKTNNNAAPGATNVGVLPMIANASAPTWTEGNLTLGSSDLHGSQRVTLLKSDGTAVTYSSDATVGTTAQTTGPGIKCYGASSAPTSVTTGQDQYTRCGLDGVLYENVAQINGVTPLMGQGATGTGALRVSRATDDPPVPGTLKATAITTAMTGTTSTQVLASQASNYLYATSCSFSNTHASVTTMMLLQDGSGGTTLWEGIVPFGGGSNVVFPSPLKVPTLGNGLYTQNVTTGSNTFASCSGYYSTASY